MKVYYTSESSELSHYGVVGMKWGVRRAKRNLNNGTDKGHNKGVKSLRSHRGKIEKKIGKLDTEHAKLEKRRSEQILKGEPKAAELKRRAARARNQSYGLIMTKRKRERLRYKADKWAAASDAITSRIETTKIRMEKNRELRKIFDSGLSDINRELVTNGQDFLIEITK